MWCWCWFSLSFLFRFNISVIAFHPRLFSSFVGMSLIKHTSSCKLEYRRNIVLSFCCRFHTNSACKRSSVGHKMTACEAKMIFLGSLFAIRFSSLGLSPFLSPDLCLLSFAFFFSPNSRISNTFLSYFYEFSHFVFFLFLDVFHVRFSPCLARERYQETPLTRFPPLTPSLSIMLPHASSLLSPPSRFCPLHRASCKQYPPIASPITVKKAKKR